MKSYELKLFADKSIQFINAIVKDGLKKFDLAAMGILLFAFYFFTQRWLVYYLQSGILQLIIVIISLLFVLYKSNLIKLKIIEISMIDLLWFLGVGVIIINIIMIGFEEYDLDVFFYAAGISFIFIAKVEIDKFMAALSFMKGMSVVYALGTIAQYFFTEGFNKFLFSFLSSSAQIRIIELIELNYYPGFGFARIGVAAGYIVVGLGIIIFFWESRNKKQKIFDFILLIILFIGLIMTGKRSDLLWMIVAVSFVYVNLGLGKEKLSRFFKVSVFLIILVLMLFIVIQATDSIPFLARIEAVFDTLVAGEGIRGISSVNKRFILYEAAWEIFWTSPYFGVGWQQFKDLTAGMLSTNYMVHNVYLQLLSEMGILGFITVMAPLVYTYGVTLVFLNRLVRKPIIGDLLWKIGLSFSLYYQTHFLLIGLTESQFYLLIPTLTYFFAIAIINAYLVIEMKSCIRLNLKALYARK